VRRALAPALAPALAIVGALLLAAGAAATHAPDHRFIVLGVVTDAEGRPLAGVPVVVTRLKTGLPYRTKTERDGFYLVVLHLHDEDEGDRLRVTANGARGELVARYDVADKKVERGTRVDVRGGQVVEDRRAFAESLRAYLGR
jgi:hypothetical protein